MGNCFFSNEPLILLPEWKNRAEIWGHDKWNEEPGNGWLPYVVCFLSINHLIATELLSRGERKIFCYFLKKMFLRPFTLPGSHQQMWTFHQAVDKEVLSKIKLVLTASVQKHLHNIIYQLGENISQQYVNKKVWQSRSQKCLQGSPRRHIGFNHNFT